MIEPSDEQREFIEAALRGDVCLECGDEITPGDPCATCAEKREILRQVFPQLYGDA